LAAGVSLLAANTTIFAACSPYAGTVVFNEVQEFKTSYLELRIMNPAIVAATNKFTDWKIGVFTSAGTTPSFVADLNAIYANATLNDCGSGSPWIKIPNSAINNSLASGKDRNFVLYDSKTNEIIDVLRLMATQSNLYKAGTSYASCSTIDGNTTTQYGMPWGSGGNKNWFRTPDGSGTWSGANTSNNTNSICGSNTAGTVNLIGLTKVASTSTVNTGTNFSYTLTASNPSTGTDRSNVVVTDTLPAGVTFVSCAATAPDTCVSASGGATWTISSLPANSTRTATLTVTASSTGSKLNTIKSTVAGSDATATVTVSTSVPVVTTEAAGSILATAAALNGTINPKGASTTVSFGYSTSPGIYPNTCTPTTSTYTGSTAQNFSCSLSGLLCNTTYYFQASGTSSGGTASGIERSFTTGSCSVTPTVNKLDAVEVSGAPLSNINTKLAGTNFSLDVLGLTSGNLVDSSYTRTVTPVLVDGSSSANCADMTALSGVTVTPSSATYASGDAGRKAFVFNSTRAAANVRVRMSDNSTPPLNQCSTDAFAIRPTSFTMTSANANADNAGLSTTATPAIKAAGANFSLAASSGVVGYNGTPVLDVTKRVAHGGAAQNGTLAGSFGAATANNGQASGAAFTYSEVGYFKLQANAVTDAAFAAIDSANGGCIAGSTSNVLSGGKYGCNIGSAESNYFGRFYPDRFTLVANSIGPVSGAARTFFYMGEPFRVTATIEARNASNAITQNYTGSFAKGTPAAAAEDSNNGSNLAANLSWSSPLGAWSNGVYTLNDANVVYTRNSTTPAAPLAALAIGIQMVDADGPVLLARDMNPATAASDTLCSLSDSTNCTFKTLGTTAFRYGQMVLFPTYGSELVTLAAPVELQYWNGSAFVLNGLDSTTTLTVGMIDLTALDASSASGFAPTVSGIQAFSGGRGYIRLSANGKAGKINPARILLGSNGMAYLQGRLAGSATFSSNPAAPVIFGLYRKSDKVIFSRERY
jgi:fimbrial isopeptide formation D2 family protein